MTDNTAASPSPATLDEQANRRGTPYPEDDTPIPSRSKGLNFRGVARAILVRPFGIVAMVGITVGLFLPPTGLGPSTCGMQRQMGLPCPGCGLTRSVSSFLQGHFSWSFQYHPMGWMIALIMVVLAVFAAMPTRWREPVITRLEPHDNKIGWLLLALFAALIGYGLLRLGFIAWDVPAFQWWRGDGSQTPPFIDPAN